MQSGALVVFLGPSLSKKRALEILNADYRPPAKRGDIFRAAKDGADVICLIDGVFFQECSVAHKEVIYAIEAGARVLGASSMGALRASELDVYGMEGVGAIYRAYKSGQIVSDDEVALTFDPFSFEPTSEPLVNIRFNLDLALQKGIISQQSRDSLFSCASSIYFPGRTYQRMLDLGSKDVPPEELERLRDYLDRERRDFKAEDAMLALKRAGELANQLLGGP
ncbi:MAG: TfuA-related McrA-glycine thioamidation protein [Methanothrix sp.]